jgi:phenylacetate-CoA ligase
VLTKAQLMEHFDELVTAPDTAGTTGRRGGFVWDFAEWVLVLASYSRAFDWAGSTAGLRRRVPTAVVSSTNSSHQSARVGASIHSR